jgi:hypothetical protein
MRKLTYFISAIALFWICAGNATAQKAPGKGADACTLVTKAEIEKLLGVTLSDGKPNPLVQNPGVLSSCDFEKPGGGQLSIIIRRNPIKYVVGAEKAEFEKHGLKLRYVTGLGTTAFFTDLGDFGTIINVFRGDYDFVSVTATMLGSPQKISPQVEKVARAVLDAWK